MATASSSIPPSLFAAAIKDLPLSNIYAKAAELQNSITHLLDSNIQMEPFAREGDQICKEAIEENDAVIARMRERIELCKEEVEARGARWSEHAVGSEVLLLEPGERGSTTTGLANGHAHEAERERATAAAAAAAAAPQPQPQQPSGRLTDEELRRRLLERGFGDGGGGGEEDDGEEEEGVHL